MQIMSISIPDRKTGEDNITKTQINYIKHLVSEESMLSVQNLGTLQASFFVVQMQIDRGKTIAKFTTKLQKPCIGIITIVSMIVISAIIIIFMN